MCELGVNPATLLVSGACSLSVPGIYMEAGHVVTEFAAVSLSVVYITMTVKKTFMVTKLTTEPAAICGGGTPLEERKKSSVSSSFPFGGLHQAARVQSLLGRTPCPRLLVKSQLCLLFASLHPGALPGQDSWPLQARSCQGVTCAPVVASGAPNVLSFCSDPGRTLAVLLSVPVLHGIHPG